MLKEKIAIFGGTFNPPHIGHIHSAGAFYDTVRPDKFLIIPTSIPPHKDFKDEVSSFHRVEMCKIAFSDIPNSEISSIEIDRGGKSYTYLTLEQLYRENSTLYFFVGTDMFLTIDEWVNFERIFELATICFIRRESVSQEKLIQEKKELYINNYSAKIIEIDSNPVIASSTEIRDLIKNGESQCGLLSPGVLDYILTKGLYK